MWVSLGLGGECGTGGRSCVRRRALGRRCGLNDGQCRSVAGERCSCTRIREAVCGLGEGTEVADGPSAAVGHGGMFAIAERHGGPRDWLPVRAAGSSPPRSRSSFL
jgi:hypothetical protein